MLAPTSLQAIPFDSYEVVSLGYRPPVEEGAEPPSEPAPSDPRPNPDPTHTPTPTPTPEPSACPTQNQVTVCLTRSGGTLTSHATTSSAAGTGLFEHAVWNQANSQRLAYCKQDPHQPGDHRCSVGTTDDTVRVRVKLGGVVKFWGVAAVAPAQAPAKTLRFGAAADTTVHAARPRRNFGAQPRLVVRAGPRVRSLLRFRIAGVKGAVEKATLRLLSKRSGGKVKVALLRAASWRERKVTWRSAPPLRRVVGSTGRLRKGRWVSVDLTSVVNKNGTYDLAVLSSSGRAWFASRNSRPVRGAPRLVVKAR